MKQLYLRVEYKDGESTAFFEGYVFHVYYNKDAKTARILNAAFEEDSFEGVQFLSIEDGQTIRFPIDQHGS